MEPEARVEWKVCTVGGEDDFVDREKCDLLLGSGEG
jgi:hypothetical protein